MTDGGAVLAVVGLVFGLFLGLRWARMQGARSGWTNARAGVPKAKADRKAARGKFWLASRKAIPFALIAALYIYIVVFVRGAR